LSDYLHFVSNYIGSFMSDSGCSFAMVLLGLFQGDLIV